MRNSEDIMADYLLKGGKMLDKTCSVCGSPLFTVKGETFCVVCKECGTEGADAPEKNTSADEKIIYSSPEQKGKISGDICSAEVSDELQSAIVALCGRIKSESRPKDCLVLMESVSIGIDALQKTMNR